MKRKIAAFLITGILTILMTACANNSSAGEAPLTVDKADTEDTVDAENTADTDATASLVVYFSWSGNTKAVAEEIQSQTGADIFEIVPEEPYSTDYDEVVDVAQEEQREEARPVIADTIDNLGDYSVVYLGFPNWWGDMPMILYSFLDNYDLSGKTIAPFVTSEGSGFSDTINSIKELEPGASVTDGLSISGSSASKASGDVTKWLAGLEQ